MVLWPTNPVTADSVAAPAGQVDSKGHVSAAHTHTRTLTHMH